jgi:hypothetical protein
MANSVASVAGQQKKFPTRLNDLQKDTAQTLAIAVPSLSSDRQISQALGIR